MRRETILRAVLLAGACAALGVSGFAPAKAPAKKPVQKMAMAAERVVQNAPVAVIDPKTRDLFLTFGYVDNSIYNPGSGQFERVHLRTWKAKAVTVARALVSNVRDQTPSPFVAPTIEAKPGETINIILTNALSPQPTCGNVPDINIPHCFNTTNLHTHGLWVTPEDPGDNVLRTQLPGAPPHHYKYDIPLDHPGGTMWYHPHSHGSTALQVGGGASGALIIRGTKKPSGGIEHGEIDTLLGVANVEERVLVLQQIQYACIDGQTGLPPDEDQSNYYAKIKTYPATKFWRCDPRHRRHPGLCADRFRSDRRRREMVGVGPLHHGERRDAARLRRRAGGTDRALADDRCRPCQHDQRRGAQAGARRAVARQAGRGAERGLGGAILHRTRRASVLDGQ